MIPYGSFFYFGLLLYMLVAVIVASLMQVKTHRIVLGTTMLMILVQYGLAPYGLASAPLHSIGKVVGFAVAQWGVAALFLRSRARGPNRWMFYAAVAFALTPLAIEKFTGSDARHLVAFVGISYTTFRALDAIFGIQDGLIKDLPVGEYMAFLLFFPAISAGPIDRYRRFRADYRLERGREQLLGDLDQATVRLFRGILYAFVLGPLVEFYWVTPASQQRGVLGIVSYMYAYSIHLFFDFAGYSAFAIGMGYVLGVRMPENFNRPFLAQNIAEFWTRWHISLSSWLRDHVYGRFVLAAMKGKWFKDRKLAGYLGSILAFGLMGLWHGAQARYLCYGLYHALLIVGHGMMPGPGASRLPRLSPLAARLVTFNLVCVGFLIFSGRLF